MKTIITVNQDIVEEIYHKIFLNTRRKNIDLFLCGGASSKNYTSNRDLIRGILKKNNRISVLYPEDMFMELLNRKKYDLLTLERFLAENSDAICIVCESPGAFVELGAFVNNSETFQKVIVLIHNKYKNAKSFIVQGPVAYVKANKQENVIYYNNDIKEVTEQVTKLLKRRFWLYGYKHRKFESVTKDINLISGQYYFIILMLFFYNQIEVKSMVNIIKSIYLKKNYDESKFEMVFMSALRRLYKDGMLIKCSISEEGSVYELTDKGYEYIKNILSYVVIECQTKVIDGLRLKIIKKQY